MTYRSLMAKVFSAGILVLFCWLTACNKDKDINPYANYLAEAGQHCNSTQGQLEWLTDFVKTKRDDYRGHIERVVTAMYQGQPVFLFYGTIKLCGTCTIKCENCLVTFLDCEGKQFYLIDDSKLRIVKTIWSE